MAGAGHQAGALVRTPPRLPWPRRGRTGRAAAAGGSRQGAKGEGEEDCRGREWDRLSEEEHGAELSAAKPLSTRAGPSKPARDPAATAPANGGAKAKPAARDSRPAR